MITNTYTLDLNNVNIDNNDFNIKKYTFNDTEYKIIKYNKEKLKNYEETDKEKFNNISHFRSVIVRDNKVVCYSPSKSINYESFKTNNENIENIYIEDFIDGTMINVFWDVVNETWEIATRSTVGGNIIFFNDIKNYKYYKINNYFENYNDSTFRTLFFEACNISNFDLNTLNRNFCYSFVLQHPLNRIVTNIIQPIIFLVKAYSIDNTNYSNNIVKINEIDVFSLVSQAPYIFANTNVKFVNKYPVEEYKTLEEYYLNDNIAYYIVGCMIYNKDGTRSKIRNKNYEIVKKLRGNQPKLQYNYLCLKQENKVNEFLTYYPEHRILFNKFKLETYNYTNELFINYISCFVRKEKQLKEYDFEYKNHMFKLHEKYKSELKNNNKNIDKKVVIDYVNSLHPAQQMFVINYKNKKKNESNFMEEPIQMEEPVQMEA